jgi:hypothetical protein
VREESVRCIKAVSGRLFFRDRFGIAPVVPDEVSPLETEPFITDIGVLTIGQLSGGEWMWSSLPLSRAITSVIVASPSATTAVVASHATAPASAGLRAAVAVVTVRSTPTDRSGVTTENSGGAISTSADATAVGSGASKVEDINGVAAGRVLRRLSTE